MDTPTRWISPIVVVKKPSGKVRICLDPRELNKVIFREYYPLKTVEDVAANLKQAQHLTTLDAPSGFYQIQLTKLTEEKSLLITFKTPLWQIQGRTNFFKDIFSTESVSEGDIASV